MCGDHLGRSGIERGRPLAGSSSYPSEDDSRGQCVRALQFSECRYVGCRDLRMYRHGFRPRLDGACRALRPGRGDSRHRGHVSAPGHGRGASRPPPRRQPGVRANAEDARHTRFHWPCNWVSPRTLKRRKPSTSLIHPFGASDSHLRRVYCAWPASVASFCAMRAVAGRVFAFKGASKIPVEIQPRPIAVRIPVQRHFPGSPFLPAPRPPRRPPPRSARGCRRQRSPLPAARPCRH